MGEIKAWFLSNLVAVLGVIILVLAGVWVFQSVKGWGLQNKLDKVVSQNQVLQANMETLSTINGSLANSVQRQNAAIGALSDNQAKLQKTLATTLLSVTASMDKAREGADTILGVKFAPEKTNCENASDAAILFFKGR